MELALIAPIMVLLVFGVLDLARAYRMDIRLENAAREGAAYAQSYPNRVQDCPSGDDIEKRILMEDAGLAGMPALTMTVFRQAASGEMEALDKTCAGTSASPGDRVRVVVTAEFDVLTPVVEHIVGDSIVLTGAAEIEVPR